MDWDSIGKGEHPAQNPPEISKFDRLILDFYFRNTRNAFVVHHHLMGEMVRSLHLDDSELPIFMAKIGIIQRMDENIEETIQRKNDGNRKN